MTPRLRQRDVELAYGRECPMGRTVEEMTRLTKHCERAGDHCGHRPSRLFCRQISVFLPRPPGGVLVEIRNSPSLLADCGDPPPGRSGPFAHARRFCTRSHRGYVAAQSAGWRPTNALRRRIVLMSVECTQMRITGRRAHMSGMPPALATASGMLHRSATRRRVQVVDLLVVDWNAVGAELDFTHPKSPPKSPMAFEHSANLVEVDRLPVLVVEANCVNRLAMGVVGVRSCGRRAPTSSRIAWVLLSSRIRTPRSV